MATRKQEHERLEDANIEKVIALLEAEKPITKKEACSLLNIAYNTTRLGGIIEKYKEAKARTAARRAALRGKPATADEITYVISEYMEGQTIDAITKATYRGTAFVKQILEEHGVPIRVAGHTYFSPELIPEEAQRERFSIGEQVYSARYDSMAKIEKEQLDESRGCYIYRVWLLSEKQLQYAWQEAYELASLEHLRKLGVKV